MPQSSRTLCLSAIFFCISSTATTDNLWIYPEPGKSPDPTYNHIDTLNASWVSNYDSPQLILWCTSDGDKSWSHKFNETVPATGNRLVPLNYSDTVPFGCHFNLASDKDSSNNNINSPGFNIQVEANKKPVIWSFTTEAAATASASSPSIASQTSKPPDPPSAAAAASSPISAPANSGSGLSTGATAGVAVGVVAGFFLPTIALFLWLRSRKRWRQAQLDRYDQRSLQKEALQPMYPASSPNDGGPVEKDGAMAQSEMDGQPVEASRRFVGELEGSGGALGGEGVAR